MLKKGIYIAISAFVLLAFSSCSKYQQVLKGKDYDAKFEMAVKYYNKKNYYKAFPLFEELITIYRGTAKAEKTYYYYAYCNYYSGDFEAAAYDFDNFARTFPNSEFAEECAFMHAYCYYEDSPIFSLDQTNTYKGINKLQLFADNYPGSTRLTRCNELIDELRLKLGTKDFENSKLYFSTAQYKAAVTSFENLIRDYPGIKYTEEAMFMMQKAQYYYAENSIESKKIDRYQKSLVYYNDFSNSFKESKFKRESSSLAESAKKKIDKLTTNSVSLKQ